MMCGPLWKARGRKARWGGTARWGEEVAKSLTLAVLLGTGGVFFAKDMPKWAFDVFSERKFFLGVLLA